MDFKVSSSKKQEMIDITGRISDIVKRSDLDFGLCHVFVPHATAAIIINENHDSNLCKDFFKVINKTILERDNYLHDTVDGNASAHIKSAIIGPSEIVPVQNGHLKLGTWQSVMLVDFDGPRERSVIITLLKD